MTANTMLRASVHTLGCKLNYAESSTIAEQLRKNGYDVVGFGEETDLFVLNTCSVTEASDRECRKLIRRTLRHSPNAYVVVTGCYAQLRPAEIAAISGVDLVVGSNEKLLIPQVLSGLTKRASPLQLSCTWNGEEEFMPASTAFEDSHRTRAFLKVQDGCDYSCAFCTIPKARGESRSSTLAATLAEARRLSELGFEELVLTGVNVGDFGRKSESSLLALLEAIERETAIKSRFRISSIEPNLLSEEIIRFVASSSKFTRHFHIPLQSGSPEILRNMRRRYKRELYLERTSLIRSLMPNAMIGADVIVGFPGESERNFEETLEFVQESSINYLHVFTYSERSDTAAIEFEASVPIRIRKERNKILRELSREKLQCFYESQVGREETVILEQPKEGHIEGYSGNYLRVRLSTAAPPQAAVVRVQLIQRQRDVMLGEIIDVLAIKQTPRIILPILALAW